MQDPIPLYDIKESAARRADDHCAALRRVVARGRFVAGPELAAFEQELAAYLGAPFVVGVKSGTDALVLTLEALGIGPGDEVITTAFTFFATAEAILRVGARPVFADIEPDTLCLSPDACAAAITARTKAIVLVHVFGCCADVGRFAEMCSGRNIALVEDACQAIGSTWHGDRLGTIGRVGTFSFYPTKNLPALGDAGAVVTGDEGLARSVRQLSRHGRDDTGRHVRVGYNSQLDEVQAAFLRVRLGSLEAENQRRRALAARYDQSLAGLVRTQRGAEGCTSSYHQYAILTPKRDRLRDYLAEHGVETGCYYDTPVHLEPVFRGKPGTVPGAQEARRNQGQSRFSEQACREVLNLPIRPSLTEAEQERIIALIQRFFSGND